MQISSTLAAQGYAGARPALEARPLPETALGTAAAGFSETLARGEEVARGALAGTADPHALVQALAETQLAVETAVTLRDRVVEAYQEILRMPV